VPLQEIKGLDDRTMVLIVRTELQLVEDLGHHAPVMTFVGIADHGAQSRPVGRPGGLALLDQVPQNLFTDDRKDDLAHGPVRFVDRRAGDLEQKVRLARNAPQVVQHLPFDPAFGAGADAVNGLDQKIDQIIGQRAAAQVDEGGQPGEPRRFRMAAEFVRRFDRDASPVALEVVGTHAIEQAGGQRNGADHLQLGQLVLDAGKTWPARTAAQPQQHGRRRGERLVRAGSVSSVGAIVGVQQCLQSGSGLRYQAIPDTGTEAVVMRTDRGSDDPVDPLPRRRFNQKITAPYLETVHKKGRIGADDGDLVPKPGFKCFGVGNGGFPKAKSGTNLGAMTFPCPTGRIVPFIEMAFDAQLLSHVLHDGRFDFSQPPGKPAMAPIEQQQQGEHKPVCSALLRYKSMIRRGQHPKRRVFATTRAHFMASPQTAIA